MSRLVAALLVPTALFYWFEQKPTPKNLNSYCYDEEVSELSHMAIWNPCKLVKLERNI